MEEALRLEGKRPRHADGPPFKWYLIRIAAFMVGTSGWLVGAYGALMVGIGALCVKWGQRLHELADEIRFES